MNKELCIIHANCQADPMLELLAGHAPFCGRFAVEKYTNYRQEKIDPARLAACRVFMYQHLGDKWGEHASEHLLNLVNPKAEVLRLPNMLFKGYWPFWTSRSPSDFGDFFLDKLIDMGIGKEEIMRLYLHNDLTRKFDFKAMFEESIAIEREKEKDCLVGYVDFMLQSFRKEQLFSTINHPRLRLIRRMTEAVLAALDLPGLPDAGEGPLAGREDPYPEFILPIHPQVAAFHGLEFIGPDTLYEVFGKQKSFEEYTNNYIDCRLNGLDSFVCYLHVA